MSWEVKTMKSRTSCFNRSFCLHLLRRFWPLWVLWLAVLILVGPVALSTIVPDNHSSYEAFCSSFNSAVLSSGRMLAFLSFAAAPLVAMGMLSYLYNPRTCGMVNSLPMRRETAFLTAAATGLAPMLAADVLVFLLMLARCAGVAGADTGHAVTWLWMVLLSNVAFYGMACFCGVLTGNVLVLPAVYVVLGCTAAVAEGAVRALLGSLIYGYSYDGMLFDSLSPIVHMTTSLNAVGSAPTRAADMPAPLPAELDAATVWPVYHMTGMGYLAGICVAGVVLVFLALLILRKRHMESAGEIVAVPVLRPVFRVCMAVGCGIVGATALCDMLFSEISSGTTLAVLTILALCVCAAVGFFTAQMLMKKTLRVFGEGWKQLGVICACLVLLAVLAECDVTGYERRTPDPADVKSVRLSFGSVSELSDPASVEAFLDLHRGLIAHKAENEASRGRAYWTLPMTYELKDGRRFTRLYHIRNDDAAAADPASDIAAVQAFVNLPEAILKRAGADRGVSADEVLYASLDVVHPGDDPHRGWTSDSIGLTPQEAESLWREGILPDAKEGNIARWYSYESEESHAEQTNVTITIELSQNRLPTEDGLGYYYDPGAFLSINVLESSAHTRAWLEAHCGVTPENEYALMQGQQRILA